MSDLATLQVGRRILEFHDVKVQGGTALLIDDSHNATEESMVAAFEVLAHAGDSHSRRIAALGHIVNLGDAAESTHARLAAPLMETGVDRVYTTGEAMEGLRALLPEHVRGPHLETPTELARKVLTDLRPGDVVLAKGSHRDTGFRDVAQIIRRGGRTSSEPDVAGRKERAKPARSARWRRLLSRTASTRPRESGATRSWRADSVREKFDVLFLGDTSPGENYQEARERKGGENLLTARGYDYSFGEFRSLLASSDVAIANLETPLTSRTSSPLEGQRPWLHRSDPELTPKTLRSHGIGVVTLANNHSADYGVEGLRDTLDALSANDIVAIGAGQDLADACRSWRAHVDLADPRVTGAHETFRLRVFSAYRGGRTFEGDIREHASADTPGSAPLKVSSLARSIAAAKERHHEEFIVVCPHWRRDYRWRSERQADVAGQLIEAGADLIIGHGSHMMQEVEKLSGRWVVHGIGNFVFNSPGRYKKSGVPPYSLIARIRISRGRAALHLYPIMTDNRETGYRPRPVTEQEFSEVQDVLRARCNDKHAFESEFVPARDEHGAYLAVDLRKAR